VRFLDPLSIEEVEVIQQGQVFKLKTKDADGKPLWAYRYRLEGRGSARPQVVPAAISPPQVKMISPPAAVS
jgi:hypothetical protein